MRAVLVVLLLAAPCVADEEDPAFQQQKNLAMRDKKKVAVVFGAAICLDRAVRSSALAEIAKEKKYAKVGGMVDKQKLYALQLRLRWADEHEAADKKNLTTFPGVRAAPCTDDLVKQVMACASSTDACNEQTKVLASFVATPDEDE